MISELEYDSGEWGILFANVSLDNFNLLLKIFEATSQPIEKICISGWHDVIYEYVLDEFKNNKIRIECVDEIVTIMFTKKSDDLAKMELKNIAKVLDNEIQKISQI